MLGDSDELEGARAHTYKESASHVERNVWVLTSRLFSVRVTAKTSEEEEERKGELRGTGR